jgi:FHS family glucose/mannose:H+ symporter-like MFS transporter
MASTLLTGIGLLNFAQSTNFSEALLLTIVAGIGAGSYDTLFNAAAVERYGAAAAKPMTLLHSAVAIGAIVGPPLLSQVSSQWHWTTSLHCIGFAHLALALGAVFVRFPKPLAVRPKREPHSPSTLSTALLPFALIAFAYVGVEAGITVFAVPYAAEGLSLDATAGQFAISIFWAGLLAGRIVTLATPRLPDARTLIVTGLLGCAVLVVGTASGSNHVGILLGAAGFALGPVYPVMIALVGQRFPQACGTATGLAAGAGCIGGFAIPWITGAIGDGVGIGFAIGSLGFWSLAISLGSEGVRRNRAHSRAPQVL